MSSKTVGTLSGENSFCIKCECGAEIAVTNDHRQLGRTIERHALEHKRKEKDPNKAEAVFEQIQDYLISQVYEKASEARNEPMPNALVT